MKTLIALTALLAAMAAPASDPPGFAMWTGSELKAMTGKLAPKINEQKVATQALGSFANHNLVMVHREGDGEAELHETTADVFVVQSGAGVLVVGGKVVGGKTTAPGEVRGTSIAGGAKRKLVPGDVATIPANTAHQVLVPAGQKITYLIVKVKK
ncbi:MAG: cupin domain-containing protein [Acidobacteria bacterium]|nr:cupin domain-containing protein [Acidobacteriota bacterium]